MKFLFRRKRTDAMDRSPSRQLWVTLFMERLQRRWSDWMERKTAGLSKVHWISIVVIFLLMGGGYFSYIIIRSLKSDKVYSFEMHELQKYELPVHGGEIPKKQSIPGGNELQSLERYRSYLDSLARSTTGKQVYDSIVKEQPGLRENLEGIIKYYKHKSNQ